MSSAQKQHRQLGASGPVVFPLALGCMGMSDLYGRADEAESIATIHAALDAGITLLDTGDYYAAGHNELLIGRALHDRRDKALISVKFGAVRGPDGSWLGMDTRPLAVKNFLAYSLTRLGLDHVDIYRPGRLDPNVPIEDTVGRSRISSRPVTSAPLGCRKWDRTPSAAHRRSTPSAISRLSTHSSAARLRHGSFRSWRNSASESRPTVCSRAACSVARDPPPSVIFVRICRASGARTRAEPASHRHAADAGDGERRDGLATGDCVGVREGPGHRAVDWRAKTSAADGIARSTRDRAVTADVDRIEEAVPSSAVAGTR